MENEAIPKKSCENCKYYLGHYIKRNTSYFYMHSGHCTNSNHRAKRKKRELELCDFWEDIGIKKEERKRAIKDAIISMSERLEELSMLLKDDEEDF